MIEKIISRLEELKVDNSCSDCPYSEKCDEVQETVSERADLCGVTMKALAIQIVQEVAQEYSHRNSDLVIDSSHSNDGWIPCSERLPEKRDWYLALFQEQDTGFIGIPFIADYLMGVHTKYTTDDGWIIANCTDIEEERAEYYKKLKCIKWMPIPAYQPKGE